MKQNFIYNMEVLMTVIRNLIKFPRNVNKECSEKDTNSHVKNKNNDIINFGAENLNKKKDIVSLFKSLFINEKAVAHTCREYLDKSKE